MSRHLYDLVKMADAGIDLKALEDPDLYAAIIQHRKDYSMLSYMNDYNTLEREQISFIVPSELATAYENDYKTMREQMIYQQAPDYLELIEKLNHLQDQFRK